MTDRAPSGGTLPNACPFLALEEDRDRRSAVADGRHRCYAEPAPQPRALTYQETFCLSPAFASCRSFLDWAARAAAEPVTGQNGAAGVAAQPLAPIPGPITPAPVSPTGAGRPPLNPVLPPATVLPPPPPGYTPPPAWQPPAPPARTATTGAAVPLAPIPSDGSVAAEITAAPGSPPPPGWQPPGTPPTDTTGFTWAVPPPWVAQPEMRTTAGLPDSARPPLDAERLGWTTAGRSGALPPAPLDEAETDGYPEWPPAPPSGSVSGTFATRRSEPFAPLPVSGPGEAGIVDAPPMAALVAADLEMDPEPAAPAGWGPGGAAGAEPVTAADEDDRWIGEDRVPVSGADAGVASSADRSVAVASETAAWDAWSATADPSGAWPRPPTAASAWPAEPVAIKVGDGPTSVQPASGGAWQGVIGETADGSVPPEAAPWAAPSVPPAAAALPVASPDAAPGGRRSSSSRWLPSFLSRDPHEETGTTAVAARTGPAAALSAATALTEDDWIEDGAESEPGASVGSATAVPTAAAPASVARTATGSAPIVAAAEVAAGHAAGEDPPGSLAPRRRRQPPGVPVDATAPATRQSQTRPATRTKGSGEWNQPKTATAGSGWRRFIPGGLPPLLLGAGALFLGALALFLLPGMLAGGTDTPTPAPTIEVGGGVASSFGPDRSRPPLETDPPSGEFERYVVERGDTLIDIARRFSVSQEILICANRELRRNPNLLSVGQELQIPPEDWTCPSQAKPTKRPGKKAPATEAPATAVP